MKNKENRNFNIEFRIEGDVDNERVVGYGSVFNKRSENLGGFVEEIAPGAFDDVLADSQNLDVRALFNHDPNLILGRSQAGTLDLSVDETGLQYSFDMPATTYGRDLLVSMQRGDVSQSSFGFVVGSDTWTETSEGIPLRTINSISRLLDVSPVTFAAYPDATTGLRSLEQHKKNMANLAIEKKETEKETIDLQNRSIRELNLKLKLKS